MSREYAKEIGKGEEFVLEMWKTYFGFNANINDDAIIIDIAKKVGISESEVKKALVNPKYEESLEKNMKEGARYRINSVPTFIIEDKYIVVGAQTEDVFKEVFEKL
ncbi:Protein-disulfide isomerase DsbC/DsbG [Lachnospiraceae bacterium TWA4]|nr:Protein-disulfide isomerase DsbC/DsbG [Lachnospiraceae bacterium TWA4]